MEFKLKPNNRNASDEELLNDIKQTAKNLGVNSLNQKDYKKHGRFSCSTLKRRFGLWNDVLKLAGLEIENYHFLSDKELLDDLRRVAAQLNKKQVTTSEYKEFGKYSQDAFKDHFGSWFTALEKVGLEKTRNLNISTPDLFENLEEIWVKLGRQPNYNEVSKPLSKYSKDVYARRFGSWRKALEAFVIYVNDNDNVDLAKEDTSNETSDQKRDFCIEELKHKTTRNINWRLRFIVMKRDNFKCKKCGRSPSTDQTVILHIDHIKPYSKGGETVLENLETLCSVCNLGKSDLV